MHITNERIKQLTDCLKLVYIKPGEILWIDVLIQTITNEIVTDEDE